MIADVASFVVDAVPGRPVLDAAAACLTDTVAVTIAGSARPDVRALAASLPTEVPSARSAACLWSDRHHRRDDAALLFGMASHVLDYDDVSLLAVCHPSVPVVAAITAWSSGREVAGGAFLAAHAIGTEVMIRIGQATGPEHYALGFHATATLGTIGAAAALARLAGLDRQGTIRALNIAASLAGGLQSNFGSPTKSLHVGFAAAAALRAIVLAQAGLAGSADAFAPRGFLRAFSGGHVDAWPPNLALGAPFAILDPGFEQKRFPCCYMLHRMLSGTLTLRDRHALTLDQVRRVMLRYPTGGTAPLRYPQPETGMQALFSAPYACVSALADGRIDLASFGDAAVAQPEVQARLADVSVIETPELAREGGLSTSPVEVELTLRDGSIVTERVERAPGSRADPLTDRQQAGKWLDCLRQAAPAIDGVEAERLRQAGLNLTETGASRWFNALHHAVFKRLNRTVE